MKIEIEKLIAESGIDLPSFDGIVEYLKGQPLSRQVPEVLSRARAEGRLLLQPRSGVGSQEGMKDLLNVIATGGQPDILSITIDSYTRLRKFNEASELLSRDPRQLNGYPLVSHGYRRGRELVESFMSPIEVRHGSPDARLLFLVSLASGITSFEGGGIGYNLPYCKEVPIAESLRAWSFVDRACGELARHGVVIDRELFGTLSAVLMPPSISLAMTLLESVLAAKSGVRCLSIAYPQGGNIAQDVAALRAIPILAKRHLPADVQVYPVLHEFMGVFPQASEEANGLILYGALTARLGGATKIITKTRQEAFGIPTASVNAEGLRTARIANTGLFDFIRLNEEKVTTETAHIVREVEEIVSSILRPDLSLEGLIEAIDCAFTDGRLDIPFSTSRQAHSKVIPARDACGAIRVLEWGGLTLSPESRERHRRLLTTGKLAGDPIRKVYEDIHYFSSKYYQAASTAEKEGKVL